MEAKPTKVPLGGAAQLFLAGLLLELVVVGVAFRASVLDFIEAQGVDVPVSTQRATPPAPAQAPTEPPPTSEPSAPAPPASRGAGTIESIQSGIRDRVDELRTVCFDTLGTPDDVGASFKLTLTIEPDGTVGQATVDGPNPTLRACLQAEASNWAFGSPDKRIRVTRTIRFQP